MSLTWRVKDFWHRTQKLLWLSIACFFITPLLGQHDRERNAFRYLAEDKVEKAYFELKNGKKHTDPAEKAFISTLCLLKEEKVKQALVMARKAVKEGLPFERFLGEPREWLKPLRDMKDFRRWQESLNPSVLLHGPMVGR